MMCERDYVERQNSKDTAELPVRLTMSRCHVSAVTLLRKFNLNFTTKCAALQAIFQSWYVVLVCW